ncbi:multiubiquitin domain-containing protein [Paludibacterium sp.]|uniref:multiubiquitin domain-containing protein n=1 Tax=Paludibacterium sp. TaxID=1917523 RepID=UPI0025E5A03D|nr:multiubiquitin domain-containing protein [Paludibacterium sp.]MBV8646335.1 multiubiquitin domain-containing protein [Paludibacterium sp.]
MQNQNELPDEGDVVDVEAYLAAGKPVPKGKKYRIRIDKQLYVVAVSEMTGQQILALAGKTPDKYLLRQKIHGAVHPVAPEQEVSFLAPGVERFMTIPNEVQEGEPAAQRLQFKLLAADLGYLNSLGLRWEAVLDGQVMCAVIYDWPLPDGYNVQVADVHVRMNAGYPDVQIDMAYFVPALARRDGRPINGLTTMQFDGRQWQQWSRHRTANSPWRVGEDDLSTHMGYVFAWLEAELRK